MGENLGLTFPPVPKSCGGGRREEEGLGLGAYKGLVCILCCPGLPMPMPIPPMPMPMPPSSLPSSYPPEYPEREERGGG